MNSRMRNIFKCLLFSIVFWGCDNDILDQQPLTEISQDAYFNDVSQVETGLTGVYSTLTDYYFDGSWPFTWGSSPYAPAQLDMMTDNGYTRYDYCGAKTISTAGINATTHGVVGNLYAHCYKGIQRANFFKEVVETVDFLSDNEKNKFLAEALFLRAFFYYQLARTYGNVPLVLTTEVDQDNPIGNLPAGQEAQQRALVLEQVVDDLNFAATHLPDEIFTGRAVKGSAQALQMHAYLLMENYAKVVEVGESFIGNTVHDLSPSYSDIFIKSGQADNKEVLFSIQWNAPTNYPNPGPNRTIGAWQGAQPFYDLISDYEDNSGNLVARPLPSEGDSQVDDYQNMDPRFDMTFVVLGGNWEGITANETFTPGDNETGYGIKKFMPVPFENDLATNVISDQDWVILRYADVLLMYAEAKNEVDGPTAEVYDAINTVRSRPDVLMPDLPDGLTQTEMRTRIRRERRVELALENWRYFDLRRWGIANTELNDDMPLTNGTSFTLVYQPHYEFWPIPENAFNKNTNLNQNTGY